MFFSTTHPETDGRTDILDTLLKGGMEESHLQAQGASACVLGWGRGSREPWQMGPGCLEFAENECQNVSVRVCDTDSI